MASGKPIEASLIYPREVRLENGQGVSLRLMEAGDKQRVLNFARALSPDDLLFLRTDITDPAIVDTWIQNIAEGRSVTVLAERGGEVAGYASIHTDGARWTRRVGEIRVQVGTDYRGLGLGKRLVGEIFRVSQDLGLKKLAAMMTPEQTSARVTFEKFGFQIEASLHDWVIDREGNSRDLMIMSLVCES
ncbi:MAG TPA: GNAT family N-acetyltransferase [Candidatus Binataceae bacterium]|nr:GNAT family N-acetyltransferase [Candidatus Binataceae bacterium]